MSSLSMTLKTHIPKLRITMKMFLSILWINILWIKYIKVDIAFIWHVKKASFGKKLNL
jgi:hypothetical protein